jgi:putative ABC transport system permease protein
MHAIHRKLLRDLLQSRGQVLAIALVLMAGIAMFVAYFSTFESLRRTRDVYYSTYRFADLFASAKRAPLSVVSDLAAIDGVSALDVRVVADVTLDIAGLEEPVTGRLISMTLPRRRSLNDVYLRRGREPEPGRPNEVLVSEAFAIARRLGPGDSVGAIINGRRRELRIVGVVLSPEYVYSIRSGELLPDPSRFGVFWMERRSLAAAFDMEGGFNDVALSFGPGASEPAIRDAVDRLLRPYGGFGAVARRFQVSNWFLENEFVQLQTAGVFVPVIFLLVAAFLLNVSLNRIVAIQREQIAALKAVGYTNAELARHYMAWSLAVSLAGAATGVAVGAWLGSGMTSMYNDFFRFPTLLYRLSLGTVLAALAIGSAAGLVGAVVAVRRVARLAPAVAMRPAAPASFHQTWIERAGLRRRLSPEATMVLRNTVRQPARTALSALGVSLAVAVLIVGLFFIDSLDVLLRLQFETAQRQDVTVAFTQPVSASAIFELRRLPGVMSVESFRSAPVEIRSGQRTRQNVILGLPLEPVLNRVIDRNMEPVSIAPAGIVMSATLAGTLGVRPGQTAEIALLERGRSNKTVTLTALTDEYLGTALYMERGALQRLIGEGDTVSGVFLRVDRARETELYRRLKTLPAVSSVSLKHAALASFRETITRNMLILVFFNVGFAAIIAYGVVYNASRIILSERSRDLASLRVLGFSRAEVSRMLLGELAVIVALSLPVGLALGHALSTVVVRALESELYRFPLVITPRTQLFAVAVVLVSAIISALIVRRRVDRLDLVAVLKTRE